MSKRKGVIHIDALPDNRQQRHIEWDNHVSYAELFLAVQNIQIMPLPYSISPHLQTDRDDLNGQSYGSRNQGRTIVFRKSLTSVRPRSAYESVFQCHVVIVVKPPRLS